MLRGGGEGLDGGVRAEEGDAPAAIAKGKSEYDETDVVLLSGWAGEDGAGADPAIPASGEAEQARAQQAGGEVFLGD